MRAFAKELLCKVAVVAENLKSWWVAVTCQPTINMITPTTKMFPSAMLRAIIVDVVNAEEGFFIQPTTGALAPVSGDSPTSDSATVSDLDGPPLVGIPSTPSRRVYLGIGNQALSILDVIGSVTGRLCSLSLFGRSAPRTPSAFHRAVVMLTPGHFIRILLERLTTLFTIYFYHAESVPQ